jgi:hypothetical protein
MSEPMLDARCSTSIASPASPDSSARAAAAADDSASRIGARDRASQRFAQRPHWYEVVAEGVEDARSV